MTDVIAWKAGPANLEAGCGLRDGRMGRAIIYFLLARYNDEAKCTDEAKVLLNQIADDIAAVKDIGYANGLAGIGWGIEWLSQNGFLDVDTDDVLEELDNVLYRITSYQSDRDISLAEGMVGKLLYFFMRYQSSNAGTHRFKRICHEECLVLLTDDLESRLKEQCGRLEGRPFIAEYDRARLKEWVDVAYILFLMSNLLELRINVVVVECLLYDAVGIVDKQLKDLNNMGPLKLFELKYDYIVHFQYVAICYLLAGVQHRHDYWKSQALGYVTSLSGVEAGIPLDDHNNLRRLIIYLLLHAYVPESTIAGRLEQVLRSFNLDNRPTSEGDRMVVLLGWMILRDPAAFAGKCQLVMNLCSLYFVR